MPVEISPLRDALSSDPVLFYSAAAALLLAVVSLSGGLGRRDFLALARPRTLLRVMGAVAIAFSLEAASAVWSSSLPQPLAAVSGGLHRLPLYLVTLAYGPSTGVVVGALFAGFHAGTALPGWPEAVLTLELAVLGWLAIFPSPRDTRLAGPLDALVAYALAWGTGGIALLAAEQGLVTLDLLLAEHAAMLPGLAACAALLALAGPGVYRAAFPGSRIHPPGRPARRAQAAGAPTGGAAAPVGQRLTAPLGSLVPYDRARDVTLGALAFEASILPEHLAPRARGQRSLAALPFEDASPLGGRKSRRRALEPRHLPDDLSR